MIRPPARMPVVNGYAPPRVTLKPIIRTVGDAIVSDELGLADTARHESKRVLRDMLREAVANTPGAKPVT